MDGATERTAPEPVDDAHLGGAGAHRPVEERGEGVDRLPRATADQVDLVRRIGRPLHLDGDALARRPGRDETELIGRDLELEAAALDACARPRDLDQLAADAPPRHLDRIARRRGTPGRAAVLGLVRGDRLLRLGHEGAQRRALRPPAQLLQDIAAAAPEVLEKAP